MNKGVVKSVQRGVVTKNVAGSSVSASIELSAVEPTKSFAMVTVKPAEENGVSIAITGLSTDTLTVEMRSSQSGAYPGNTKVGWQVIEFY